MDVSARPLSAEDLSILALENDVVAGHTCKVIMLGEGVSADRVRAMLASRIARAPELALRLQAVDGAPCWIPVAEVDLDAHVVTNSKGALDGRGLRGEVARIFAQRLDRSRPLWRIDVIPEIVGGAGALVWRIHHALADGSTAMRIANAVLWDAGTRAEPAPAPKPARQLAGKDGDHGRTISSERRFGGLATAVREAPRPWRRSPFDGRVSGERAIAFASAGLASLHRATHEVERATINDAVLALVAGALRRWLEDRHGSLGAVRVKVPVSLHGDAHAGGGAAEPGNRDSFFCLDLPLTARSPLARLATIRDATRVRKDCHDAQHIDKLTRQLGDASPRLRRFAEKALANPRSFALNVSNVRGPAESVNVDGVTVRAMYSVAEIRERHALRIAVVSFAGALEFGLCADPALLPNVERLAQGIEAEAQALADSVVRV
jgi:diacylglycerol O-acyltransferase